MEPTKEELKVLVETITLRLEEIGTHVLHKCPLCAYQLQQGREKKIPIYGAFAECGSCIGRHGKGIIEDKACSKWRTNGISKGHEFFGNEEREWLEGLLSDVEHALETKK